MGPATYYIEGLFRQANAAYAREYLGIGPNDVLNIGYIVQNIPLWNDVRIPMSSTRPSVASAPVATPFQGTVYAYRWDNPGAQRSLYFEIQIPHGFNQDPAYGIRLHIHWSCASNMSGLGVVEWGVEATTANIAGAFGGTLTYYGTGATTQAYQHVVTPINTFTGLTESAVIVGRLFRSDAGGDTYAGNDVYGLSLDAHYVVQQTGSTEEIP